MGIARILKPSWAQICNWFYAPTSVGVNTAWPSKLVDQFCSTTVNTKDGGRRLGFASRRECNCCERIPLSHRLLLASPNAQCFWSRKTCLLCLDACRNKGWQLPSASQITPVRITEIEVDDKCQTNFLSIEMYCLEDMPPWWTCQPPSFTVWRVLLLGQPGTF